MNKKLIGLITGIVLVLALFFLLKPSGGNPLKDTKWIGFKGDVLTIGENLSWVNGEDYISGEYVVYTNSKAAEVLDSCAEKHLAELGDDVPEAEKWGFESEIEARKKELKEGSFVLEEKLTEMVIGGVSVEPQNNIYIVTKGSDDGGEYITLKNPINNRGTLLATYTEDYSPTQLKDFAETSNIKDIGFQYKLPKGYKVVASDDDLLYITNGEKSMTVSAMRETPLSGIMDEYAGATEYAKGYLTKDRIGPIETCLYLFEAGGTTYLIESDSEPDLATFVDSIK